MMLRVESWHKLTPAMRPARCSAVLILLSIGAAPPSMWAQGQSLAEMAASAKAKKTEHARIVLDDDSRAVQKPLLPNIWDGDSDNTADIVKAITDYRKAHTQRETEQLMHDWYDRNVERLANATDENRRLNSAHDDYNKSSGYQDLKPGDYRQYQEAQNAALRHLNDDRARFAQNKATISHIASVLQKVKSSAQTMSLDFDWFKLQCGANACS
jgi:hypothetical protein